MTVIEFNHQIVDLQSTLELFTKRFTTDHEESKDLVQDTILKAITYRDKFTTNTNLKGWLFTIMRNTFINNYRKSQRAKTTHDDTKELYYLNVADNHTFNLPDCKYQYKDVINCIDKIKTDLLVPFRMHLEGFKYQEIADELNIPIGTVKNRIFHARKEIQRQLGNYN
ncbi:MAG: RNA polymerase sigma factor [Bacteroidota bacterium]